MYNVGVSEPLKTALEAALSRHACFRPETILKQPIEDNDVFSTDKPRHLVGSRRQNPSVTSPVVKKDEEKREITSRHRNTYAVNSYAELLARVHAGQTVQICNTRFGYLPIQDLKVTLRLNDVLQINNYPYTVLRDSLEMQRLCDGHLVEMEGVL